MYRPLLTNAPAGPDAWWSVLRELVNGWYGVRLARGDVGDSERRRLGQASGLEVSAAFDEWAAFNAELDAAGVGAQAMRDAVALDWHPELGSITLLLQSEKDLYWSVDAEHAADPDPPVVTWLLDYDHPGTWQRFKPWSPTTTGFAFDHLCAHLMGSVAGLSAAVPSVDVVDGLLSPVAGNRVEVHGQVVYEAVDLLAVVGPSHWSDGDEMTFSLQLGDAWAGRVPGPLVDFARAFGGVCHGALAGSRPP